MGGILSRKRKEFFDIFPDNLKKVIDLNLMGTVLPSLILGKIMANQKSGSIINISSMASKDALSRVLGYSIGKAGVEIFTKWMAMELAAKFGEKMRVNALKVVISNRIIYYFFHLICFNSPLSLFCF